MQRSIIQTRDVEMSLDHIAQIADQFHNWEDEDAYCKISALQTAF